MTTASPSSRPAAPREPYPSDLNDADWSRVSELVEEAPRVFGRAHGSAGRPVEVDLRAVVDGVLYQARTGIPWRYLPRDIFPVWQTVYAYGTAWTENGTLQRLCEALGMRLHRSDGGQGPTVKRRRKVANS